MSDFVRGFDLFITFICIKKLKKQPLHATFDTKNLYTWNWCIEKRKDTAESKFLFRDHDRPITAPSLGVLNHQTSLTVLKIP